MGTTSWLLLPLRFSFIHSSCVRPDSVPPNNLSVSLIESGQRNAFSLTRNGGHDNLVICSADAGTIHFNMIGLWTSFTCSLVSMVEESQVMHGDAC
jgi:hypothetical protein